MLVTIETEMAREKLASVNTTQEAKANRWNTERGWGSLFIQLRVENKKEETFAFRYLREVEMKEQGSSGSCRAKRLWKQAVKR